MPDMTKPPLHTLPHDELLAKLESLTSLRAVRDPASDTGWKIEPGPFPGWATVVNWQQCSPRAPVRHPESVTTAPILNISDRDLWQIEVLGTG